MRVNRRYGAEPGSAQLARFAACLTAHGCHASASQVSRWESGLFTVPFRAINGYERALGLAEKTLTGIADALYRQSTDHLAPSRLDRRIDPDDHVAQSRAEDLLDLAFGNAVMSGSDWDDLSTLLCASKNVLMANRHWSDLTARLLSEQLVADGAAWRLRSEATHRLLWHPRARPHVIAACAAVIRDVRCPIVVEPFAILDLAAEPDVAALLISQLADPVDERAIRGALLASVSKVRTRQFTRDQLRRVADSVVEMLTDPRLHAFARSLAGELVGRLPPPLRDQSVRRLHRAFTLDRGLAGLVAEHRTADVERSRRVVDRIAGRVLSSMPSYTDATSDEMLDRLIDEMLFSTNSDVRLHAAQLTGATPFSAHLADALCAELGPSTVIRGAVTAPAILEALPFVGTQQHRTVVETVVLAPGLEAATTSAAAWSISHLPGQSAATFWSAALDRHRRNWSQTRSAPAREALSGLTYALGIAGDSTALTAICSSPEMPPDSRAAAHWWTGLPSVITSSARI